MMAMLELRAELSNLHMKKNNNLEVLCSTLSAIKNKYEDAGVSVDKTELVSALVAEAPKDYLSSVNTQKDQLE